MHSFKRELTTLQHIQHLQNGNNLHYVIKLLIFHFKCLHIRTLFQHGWALAYLTCTFVSPERIKWGKWLIHTIDQS